MYPVWGSDGVVTFQDFLNNKKIIPLCHEGRSKSFDDIDVYGQSKVLAENVVKSYCVPWVVLRKGTIVEANGVCADVFKKAVNVFQDPKNRGDRIKRLSRVLGF